jgi:CRP-like cAMP-binding protein
MIDLLRDELFGLNGLVNLSNFVFIVAFSVRGLLPLRLLSIASSIIIIPYYYLQPAPLWPPIFWDVTFVLINGGRVAQLLLERRPVVLSEREQGLYRLAFTSVDKREFLRLASLARWVTCPVGWKILEVGQVAEEAIILISGDVEATLNDRAILKYRPGEIIGDANVYSGIASPVDIVARTPLNLAIWNIAQLRAFLERRPELRTRLLEIEGADLSRKLHALAAPGIHGAADGLLKSGRPIAPLRSDFSPTSKERDIRQARLPGNAL